MRLEYVLFNLVAAAGLFFLNGVLGKLQYDLPGSMLEYGKFTFGPSDNTNFSGNFFQKDCQSRSLSCGRGSYSAGSSAG